MKLEVGMYVRTKALLNYDYVKITKIKHIEEKEHCLHIWLEDKDLVTETHILKASHNIIDLIEVGDYVNGYKVRGTSVSTLLLDNFNMIKIEDYEIKSIVTKEQFESMTYKVEE